MTKARDLANLISSGNIFSDGAVAASEVTGLAQSATVDTTNAGNITSGTFSAARLPAFSGDATSSAGTSQLTLASSGVVAGTYTKFSVDAKGRVTSGTTLLSADLPTYTGTLTSSQVTDALGFTPYNSTNPSGYISGNQNITFSGDASGSGATSVTLMLANSGVVAGTYGSSTAVPVVTVDSKGRVTGVSTSAISGSLSFTGDVTGSGTTGSSTALTLANSGVVAGTYTKITVDAKGRATGGTTLSASDIPSLDASKITSGVIDAARLPSYVDDVLEYANLASFPATGETGKIYVALDTNKAYRWSGSAYVYITSGAVDSVAGRTGVVTLTSSDVGLGFVENKNSATIRSEITSTNVTTALGFTPYNSTNPNGYITSSALSSYLPLTGGTISGVVRINNQLQVGQNTNGTAFIDAYGGYAWFGRDSNSSGIRIDASGNVHTTAALNSAGALTQSGNQILHAGNYSSYALPLSGGTISGAVTVNAGGGYPATLNSTQRYIVGIRNTSATGTGWWLVNDADGRFIIHGNGISDLASLNSSGTFNATNLTANGNQVLHSGNYSSYALPLTGGTISGSLSLSTAGYIVGSNHFERHLYADFSNGVANLATDIRFGNVSFWGYIEVEITGTYSNQNTPGKLTKLFAVGTNPGNNIYSNVSRVADAMGPIVSNIVIGDFGWDATNSTYRIPISHIVSTGNGYTIKVRMFTHGGGASSAYTNLTLSPNYTLTALAQQSVSFNGNLLLNGTDQVLHASNYNSYSPMLTGGGASGTWAINITGNSATTSQRSFSSDIASSGQGRFTGWYSDGAGNNGLAAEIGVSGGAAYILSYNRSTSSYGTLAFNATNIQLVPQGGALTTTGGNVILHAGNYNSYSPTLTGSGASGTWGISISGNASTASQVGGYTSDGWLRKVGDSTQFQIYGNTRTMIYRTDGTTNPHGGGSYAHIFYYGGSSDSQRMFIINTDGRLYSPYHGWLDTLSTSGSAASLSNTSGYLVGRAAISESSLDTTTATGIYAVSKTGHSSSLLVWNVGGSTGPVQLDTNYFSDIRYRSQTDSSSWNAWKTIIHSANYSSYAVPLTGGTMSGRLTTTAWTTSGRNYSNEWIEFGNYSGLYSPNNGAHFYPNNGTYGGWRAAGSRNGWHGIEFDASNGQVVLMINPDSNTSGFHNNSYGWQMRWNNGVGYIYKNAYGGGTAAIILDSVNYTNYITPADSGPAFSAF